MSCVFHFFHLSLLLLLKYQQQRSKARQPRHNSGSSSFSLCDCHGRCFSVCVRERTCVRVLSLQGPAAVGTKNTVVSRIKVQFSFSLLRFCRAVCCCCVPLPHRKLLTLWQPWQPYVKDFFSRQLRTVLPCVRVCVRIWACHPEPNGRRFQPILPLNLKSIRAAPQRCNPSEPSKAHDTQERLCSFSTCDTPRKSCQPHPEGKPCTYFEV